MTLSPHNKNILNNLTNKLRYELKEEHNKNWKNKMEKFNLKKHTLWRIAKALRKDLKNAPHLKHKNKILTTDKEKAEIFAEIQKEQYSTNKIALTPWSHKIEKHIDAIINLKKDYKFKEVTTEEIKTIITQLKKRIAPGPDKITNTVCTKKSPSKTL